jgi:UDP-N-acetylmuramate--alanine ligase
MEVYHLIGIKGAGMSSLACLLQDLGYCVQGSDVNEYFFTEANLAQRKIEILPFNKDNIKKVDNIIVGNAFENNIEHKEALALGCKIFTYNEFIGALSKKYFSIAISGSHGKTTTTNIIKQILALDYPVNYLIGDGQGGGNKASKYFVFEACEYKRHFLYYEPKIAVITNIDYDHPDYYHDIYDVQDAFKKFLKQAEIVVYNGDDPLIKLIIGNNKTKISFGLNNDNDYYAENISNNERYSYYDLYIKKRFIGKIKIPMFGIHSVYNSLCAIATTNQILDDVAKVKTYLAQYKSGKRRFEEHFINKQIIISDYAHHPKEISATIEAVSVKYPYKKIIVYFQPHTYTRTSTFIHAFAEALKIADFVYLREIFASAREHDKKASVNDLAKLIDNSKVINDESYIEEFKKFNNSVIIFMGAGDIDKYCTNYLNKVKNNHKFTQTS